MRLWQPYTFIIYTYIYIYIYIGCPKKMYTHFKITKQVDWTERFCWIPSPFTRPHTTRLLFMGIPKRQSLCIETHNSCWIESNHWTWMHANTEGIASWCVLLHRFVLSVVSGREWTSIWEVAVRKRQKDVIKFFYMLKMKRIIIKTWFAVIWSVYTSFWDTLYIDDALWCIYN